ncbi:MAG: helix-turn-helix domain-containing protein [Firmicutes bacterium]|nr:helix-turn-helix domain-containing protein [Bacillota bacterium]
MAVKNNLKTIRMQEYLLNQSQFAKNILQIDYRQYNRYENGTVPKLDIALKICKKLNKPLEQVFYLSEED